MKKFIIRTIVFAILTFFLWSLFFDFELAVNSKPIKFYLFCLTNGITLAGLFHLDDKGWNSWSRVFDLFKRKKDKEDNTPNEES